MRFLKMLRAKAGLFCGTALVGLALTACGEPIVGTVVAKEYDDADTYLMPISQCVPVTVGTTTTTSCTTTLVQQYDPERWLLIVEDAEGDRHDVSVAPSYWDAALVGDHYEEIEE